MDYKKVYSVEQYAEKFSGTSAEELRAEWIGKWIGKTLEQIRADCDDVWPQADDNEYLAACIYHFVNG